jgi:hypothetical protein
MSTAYRDFVLVPYEKRRRDLMRRFVGDQQGFFAADGMLRLRLGMILEKEHEVAMLADARDFRNAMCAPQEF